MILEQGVQSQSAEDDAEDVQNLTKYETQKVLKNLRYLSHYIIQILNSKYLPRTKMQGIDDDSANSRVRSNRLFVRLGNLYPLQSSRWYRPKDQREQASCSPYHLRTHLYFEEFLQPRIVGDNFL